MLVNCLASCTAFKTWPAPHSGDAMQVGVTRSGGFVTEAAISDLTAGHRFSLQVGANGAPAADYAEVVEDPLISGGVLLPVVNFGTLAWSAGNITIGTPAQAIGSLPIGSTGRQAHNLTTKANVLQIQTGAIGGPGNNSFSSSWKHS